MALLEGAMTMATVMTGTFAARRRTAPVTWIALLLLLGGLWILGDQISWKQATLYVIGFALGVVLYHAAFGFTSAWRVFIADRRGAGLRAQMLMLGVASLLFFPALAAGHLFGHPVSGHVAPLSTALVVGAFMFGVGMQLGGGCASGTLYTVGGGSIRMLLTLAAFILGSTVGVYQLPWWQALPGLPAVSLVESWGLWPALAANIALFAAIAWATRMLERRRHGQLASAAPATQTGTARWLRGPWPLLAGAVALALLNFATLALAGRPWGITSAFALWGSKLAGVLGFDPANWTYWQQPANAKSLHGSLLGDVTTVMDIGIVLGALLAAGLARRYAPQWRVPLRSVLAAVTGGLLLGYGARLAYGCNIGAYFSGIASSSVHGWVWLVAAFAGSVAGTRLRPWFGLAVEGRGSDGS
jgi:uncharacterized membrane protein YedE/YeeE